ncbi:MAG: M48 family metallopeptidase [Synergistaceae bacterium]|nr:M48 family metallopeptidase [Synergistaceae bacterium]
MRINFGVGLKSPRQWIPVIVLALTVALSVLSEPVQAETELGANPVRDKVTYKAGAKMPDPAGVSLQMLQNAWDRLRKVTKISAWLVYDDQDILNAYMTKNDKGDFMVVVYRGLMKIFRTEDEIAGVLGHESGHAALGHLEKGIKQQVGVGVAASILSKILGGNAIADLAVGTGAELVKSGYSREAEVEADDYGTEQCAKAGYSSMGLYNAVKRMADAGAVTPPSGFNSHPPTERRMKRLKEKADYWAQQLKK